MRTGGPLVTSTLNPPKSSTKGPDAVDMSIIEGLIADPRATSRSLAAAAGVTETTAASRLRSLVERDLVALGLTYDWEVGGYPGSVFMWIGVEGRSVSAVGSDIARLPTTHTVVGVLADHDLFAHVLLSPEAPGVNDARALVESIDGAVVERSDAVLSQRVGQSPYASLPLEHRAAPHLPNPALDLDELDHAILEALGAYARTPNRVIARDLGTSERTVRSRLARLEQSGLVRLQTFVDPATYDLCAIRGLVSVSLRGPIEHTVGALKNLPHTVSCSETTGQYDLQVFVNAESPEKLGSFIENNIDNRPEVRSTSTQILTTIFKQDHRLRRHEAM